MKKDYYAKMRAAAIREVRRIDKKLDRVIYFNLSMRESEFIRLSERRRNLSIEYNL